MLAISAIWVQAFSQYIVHTNIPGSTLLYLPTSPFFIEFPKKTDAGARFSLKKSRDVIEVPSLQKIGCFTNVYCFS
jgi:hypothetical protein